MPRTMSPEREDEYLRLFDSMEVRPERLPLIESIFRRVTGAGARKAYEAVESAIGVPWFVVASIHSLESDGRFDRHLHNGDPLTARTVRVPAGRPIDAPASGSGTPYTWSESAIDALKLRSLDGRSAGYWTPATIAFELEGYNGEGYRNKFPWVKSPYLWSFSNIYTCGKFVGDHNFSPDAVSAQCGGMVLLRTLMDAVPEVRAAVVPKACPPYNGPDPDAAPTPHAPPDDGGRDWAVDAPRFPGRYLHRGSAGPDIRRLQDRLAAVGARTLGNGLFDDVTELAVALFQARAAGADGEPLEIDGVVGPLTWCALFGPASVPPPAPPSPTPGAGETYRQTLLDVAHSQVGVMEQPLGSNGGPQVDQYLASVGRLPGLPWCMSFVYWAHAQATLRVHGSINRVPKTAGVQDGWIRSQHLPEITIVPRVRAIADPMLVQPGMVFFLNLGGSNGHCGIVMGAAGGLLTTIEGNTNNNGSREGIGVYVRQKRRIDAPSMLGFADYCGA